MRRIVVIFAVLVAVLGAGLWIKVRQNNARSLAPSGGSGVIEGVSVSIAARIAARIEKIGVEEGGKVEKSKVIVELACDEQLAVRDGTQAKLEAAERSAEAAKAQMAAALQASHAADASLDATGAQSQALKASRDVTQRQAVRLSKLQGEGGATEMDLDRTTAQAEQLTDQMRALDAQARAARGQAGAARAQADAARAQASAAVAAIAGAQADLRRATAMVAECSLSSPVDGVVLVRAFEPGEVVLPGSRILEVTQLDPVETKFFIPNRELARAKVGGKATVVADAYPGKSFAGQITAVASEAEFTPRNVQTREDRDRLVYAVKLRIPNPDHALRPGMPVEVGLESTAP